MTLGQEVLTVIRSVPEGVSFPDIYTKLEGRRENVVQVCLIRLELEGCIKVKRSGVHATYYAPGPIPVYWNRL